MIYPPKDYLQPDLGLGVNHPVYKSVKALHDCLPSIWFAIKKSQNLIPVASETSKITKRLKEANLGVVVENGTQLRLRNNVTELLHNFENRNINFMSVGYLQESWASIDDSVQDYFDAVNRKLKDADLLLNDIERKVQGFASSLRDLVENYADYIHRDLQQFTDLQLKVNRVSKAIKQAEKLTVMFQSLTKDRLRELAGENYELITIFEREISSVLKVCLEKQVSSMAQLVEAMVKWEKELKERQKRGNLVNDLFMYMRAGNLLEVNHIDLFNCPDVFFAGHSASKVKVGGYVSLRTLLDSAPDSSFEQSIRNVATQRKPSESISKQVQVRARAPQEVVADTGVVVVKLGRSSVGFGHCLDALRANKNIRSLSALEAYKVLGLHLEQDGGKAVDPSYWLEHVVLSFDVLKEKKDTRIKNIGIEVIEEKDVLYNGNAVIKDVVLFSKERVAV